MKKILNSIFLLSSILVSSTAFCIERPHWNLAQVSYISAGFQNGKQFLSGFSGSASTLLTDNIFIGGSYSSFDGKLKDFNSLFTDDFTLYSISAGYRYSYTASTDFYGKLSYENQNIKLSYENSNLSNANYSTSGIAGGMGLALGVRSHQLNNFELIAEVGYQRIANNTNKAIDLSAFYHINKQFSVGAGFKYGGDLQILSLTGRFSF